MNDIEKILDKVYICLAKNSLDSNDKAILLAYADAYISLSNLHNNNKLSPEKEELLKEISEPYFEAFSKNNLTPGDELLLKHLQDHLSSQEHGVEKDNVKILSNGHSLLEDNNFGFFQISSVVIMTILLGFIIAVITLYIK